MSPDPRPPSWWQTAPGMMTGVAAIITAVTGLVIALDQIGVLPGIEPGAQTVAQGSGESAPAPGSGDAVENPAAEGGSPPSAPVGSPALPTVQAAIPEVRDDAARYEIRDARTENRSLEEYTLFVTVRLFNEGAYDMNFWDRNFRLLVDGLPRAPVGGLNEIVAGRSVENGQVEFVVPRSAGSLLLRIYGSDDRPLDVPLTITSP